MKMNTKSLVITTRRLIPIWLVAAVAALVGAVFMGECTLSISVAATCLMAQCLGLVLLCELLDPSPSED
ncbi:MAG: hypothetical protein KF886_25870 [Candidatus Hydrogenedentes bacterium]|nr:hypothetical protein [Candidatus Hydrogenedentota bacterium]